ncbi:MAG: protein kinase, partial [Proteobacteria bacterium]|nr:protein kinase [Pseudomonadota bacterium]
SSSSGDSVSGSKSDLTSGLGTSVYGSPEQLNGSAYDEKADIYSLGIILFELFYPIRTHMERARVLTELKETKQFPTDFLRRWPKEAALIWCCLAADPANRPSADEILESELLDQDLEEHYLRISEDNEDLRELLRIQFEENNKLKIENELQALEIEALKEKIRLLQVMQADDYEQEDEEEEVGPL